MYACTDIIDCFLRAVDGVSVQDWDLEEIKNLTVGLEGTHVAVELRRGPHTYNMTLIRVHPERVSLTHAT